VKPVGPTLPEFADIYRLSKNQKVNILTALENAFLGNPFIPSLKPAKYLQNEGNLDDLQQMLFFTLTKNDIG